MDDPLEEFLKSLAHERQASATTLRNYRTDVRTLLDLAAEQGQTPLTVTRETVRAWLRTRAELVSRATIRRQISALRTFCSWMVCNGLRCSNPMAEIRGPRREWKLPRVLSIDEASRLMEAPAGDSQADVRARAILEVLYGTGMRVGALRALDVSDITLPTAEILLRRGKGDKDSVVIMGAPAIQALRAWQPVRQRIVRAFGRDQRALFINFRDGGRLDTRSIARVVREVGQLAGIRQRVHPHLLRHCCFTHMVERGADLESVRKLAGHESLATTQIYIRLAAPARLRTVITERHPRG